MTQTFIGDVDLTANPEAARSSWEVADRDALTAAATDPRAVTLGEQPHPAGPVRRHGLTARSDLPDTLRLRTHEFRRDLQQEFQPVGFVENQLVEELARHLAGMELAGNSEERVLRHCGRERRDLDALLNPGGRLDDDACVTAAVASQPLERLARYRRQHERGFCAALTRLQAQQATRKEAAVRDQFARFRDEKTCADYLRKRVRGTLEECPRCGGRSGYWLSTGRWECRDCGRQVGLRSGSVMEGLAIAAVDLVLGRRRDPG